MAAGARRLPDVQAAVFLTWTLPLAAGLALRLYAPKVALSLIGPRRGMPGVPPVVDLTGMSGPQPAWHALAQETTVSSLGRPVSSS